MKSSQSCYEGATGELTKQSGDVRLLHNINGGDCVDVEVGTLLDRAAHHAQGHLVQGAGDGQPLLLYQLQHQIRQLGEWTVQNLQPGSRTESAVHRPQLQFGTNGRNLQS